MPATPKPKPYALLRGAYTAIGYNQVSFGKKIGKSESYITSRLGGKQSWEEDDMYKIMDLLKIPYEEMHLYFPPRGIPRKLQSFPAQPGPRRLVIAR